MLPIRGTTNSTTVIKRAAPIDLAIEGLTGANPGFYYTAGNTGLGLACATTGCGTLSVAFNTGGLNSAFVDMATYAGDYDEFRVKKLWFDCMYSTNSVAPSGTAVVVGPTGTPIFQIVFDPNSQIPPSTNTTLLSYNNVEIWHPSTGNSRRIIEIEPRMTPISAGLEVQGTPWIANSFYNSSTLGFLKMFVDISMCTAQFQGTLTIYPTIEVEFRRQT
jgi:hypothetical protein